MTNSADAAPAPKKKRSFLRCCVLPVAIVVILAGVAIVALPRLIPSGWLRDEIVKAVEAETGRTCSIKDVSLSLGGVTVKGLTLAGKAAGDEPLLSVESAELDADLLDLLSNKLQVRSVKVKGLALRIERAADGTLSIDDLLSDARDANGAVSMAGETQPLRLADAGAKQPSISLESLTLSDSHVKYIDTAGGVDATLGIPEVTLTGSNLNKPMTVAGTVVPGKDPSVGTIGLGGTLDLFEQNRPDPNGTAEVTLAMKAVQLLPVLKPVGVDLTDAAGVTGGSLSGPVVVTLQEGAPVVTLKAVNATGIVLGEGDSRLTVPDTRVSAVARFADGYGTLRIENGRAESDLAVVTASTTVNLKQQSLALDVPVTVDVQVAKITSFLRANGMGQALPEALAGDLRLEGTTTIRGGGVTVPMSITAGRVEIPFAPAKSPLVLTLNGNGALVKTADAFRIEAELKQSTLDIPGSPYLNASRAGLDAVARFDVKLNRLEIEKATVTSLGEGADWVALGARGTVETVTGDSPSMTLAISGYVDGTKLSALLPMKPFSAGAVLDGRIDLAAKATTSKDGLILSGLKKDKPLLASPGAVTLRNLVPGISSLPLGRVSLTSDRIEYDPKKQRIRSSQLDLTAAGARLRLVPDVMLTTPEGAPSATGCKGAVSYRGVMAREGSEALLKATGVSGLPLNRLDVGGAVEFTAGGAAEGRLAEIRFSKTVAKAGLTLEGQADTATLTHDMHLQMNLDGTARVTIESGTLTLSRENRSLARLGCEKGLVVQIDANGVRPEGTVAVAAEMASSRGTLDALIGLIGVEPVLAPYAPTGTLSAKTALKLDGTRVKADSTIDWRGAGLRSGSDALLRNADLAGTVRVDAASDGRDLTVTTEEFAIGKGGSISASLPLTREAGGGYTLGDKALVRLAVTDAGDLSGVVPLLAVKGYELAGGTNLVARPQGRLDSLGPMPFGVEFAGLGLSSREKNGFALELTSGRLGGVLDPGPLLAKSAPADPKNPYAALKPIEIQDGRIDTLVAVIDGMPVKRYDGVFTMSGGTLRLGRGEMRAGEERFVVRDGSLALADARQPCHVEVEARKVDLAELFGTVPGFGTIEKGVLSLPDSSLDTQLATVKKRFEKIGTKFTLEERKHITRSQAGAAKSLAVMDANGFRASWNGLDADTILQTIRLQRASLLVQTLVLRDIPSDSPLGRVVLQVVSSLKLKGPKDSFDGDILRITGFAHTPTPGVIDIPILFVEGGDTRDGMADFLLRGEVQKGVIKLDIWAVDHVDRFIKPKILRGEFGQLVLVALRQRGGKENPEEGLADILNEMGRAGEISFRVQGPYDALEAKGVDSMLRDVIKTVAKRLTGDAIGGDGKTDSDSIKDKIKDILKGKDDTEGTDGDGDSKKGVEDLLKDIFN